MTTLKKKRFSDGLKLYYKCTLMILSVGQGVIIALSRFVLAFINLGFYAANMLSGERKFAFIKLTSQV